MRNPRALTARAPQLPQSFTFLAPWALSFPQPRFLPRLTVPNVVPLEGGFKFNLKVAGCTHASHTTITATGTFCRAC